MNRGELLPPGGAPASRKTLLLAVGLLVCGLACLLVAFVVLDMDLGTANLLYDLGLSILIAGGLSVVVGNFTRVYEERDRQREEEVRQRLENARREQEELQLRAKQEREHLEQRIMAGLDSATAILTEAKADAAEVLRKGEIHNLVMKLDSIHDDISNIRVQVDPQYEHPNKPYSRAIIAETKEMSRAGQKDQASPTQGTPPPPQT